jgi:hypothetical protein
VEVVRLILAAALLATVLGLLLALAVPGGDRVVDAGAAVCALATWILPLLILARSWTRKSRSSLAQCRRHHQCRHARRDGVDRGSCTRAAVPVLCARRGMGLVVDPDDRSLLVRRRAVARDRRPKRAETAQEKSQAVAAASDVVPSLLSGAGTALGSSTPRRQPSSTKAQIEIAKLTRFTTTPPARGARTSFGPDPLGGRPS